MKNITWTRVVTQDNGYIGMGGGFAQHVRVSDCGSFRNNRGWSHNAFAFPVGAASFILDGRYSFLPASLVAADVLMIGVGFGLDI